MAEATFEDLAFLKRFSRSPDKVGWRVCIELVRNIGNREEETRNSDDGKGHSSELRSHREKRGGNGVKNLNRSEVIPEYFILLIKILPETSSFISSRRDSFPIHWEGCERHHSR